MKADSARAGYLAAFELAYAMAKTATYGEVASILEAM
jgi:hypothetical protein